MFSKGFTLIEILTVILILSVVISLVAPMYRGGHKTDLTVLGRKMASDLRYARSIAISSGESKSVVFDFDNNIYRLPGDDSQKLIPDEVSMTLTLDIADINKKYALLYFYPDGTSSGGVINMKNGHKNIKIIVSWLHGGVSLER